MKIIYEIIWRLIAAIHFVFVIGNIASIFILPFYVPWFIFIPLITFEINLIFNRAFASCPITSLENKIRTKLDKPIIKSFLGHYVFWPVRRFYRKFK